MNLDIVLKSGESTTIEFKERFNNSVFKTLSAFLNTEGGTVYIGISNKMEAVGVEFTNEDVETITNRIVHKLGIHPKIKLAVVKGKRIMEITVSKSPLPVAYESRYYKRVGNTTREMLGDELKTFFLKGTNWDAITGDYTIDEIDEESVRKFIKLAIKSGRLRAVDESEDIKTVLKRLKLIPNGKLTNGAILLFGKDPQKYFINAVVRVGRLKDESTIIGDRLIAGNLFRQVEEVEEAIKGFINVRYEIKDELVRKNIWDYPLDAIREALLNALIHRDYFKFNVQTQIKIFEGYIWFFNIGGLPEGITIELLKGPHSSVPRNPLIAHIFYLAGFIEEYGSGIRRMTESLSGAGLPYPEFKEEFAGFSLYMRKDKYSNERLREMGLNERQIRAVMYVKEEGKITNKVYRNITGLSDEGARIDLTELIDRGLLQRKNKGRGAHYVLK